MMRINKRKLFRHISFVLILLQVLVLLAGTSVFAAPLFAPDDTESVSSDTAVSSDKTDDSNVYHINDLTDFNTFVSDCSIDGWSLGMEVSLDTDLIIPDADFGGVPYFNGTFEGNNHTITVNYMAHAGSNYGLFRYIGSKGTVENLTVDTVVAPSGSAENVGGIAGVNYGTIINCNVLGKVTANTNVGGIVGVNKENAIIIGCVNEATIRATNKTGGIAGYNSGKIVGCSNRGVINDEEQAKTTDISDVVDVNGFNLVSEVTTRNDAGGICGYSDGFITSCVNTAEIGYAHSGYNVGGIVGRQDGVVMNCLNEGRVLGRKDVGGIVGQAEPYIEEEYLSQQVTVAKESINDINDTISSIVSTAQRTSEETSMYAENLYNEYLDEKKTVSDNIAKLRDMGPSSEELDEYYANIEASKEKIEELEKQAKELLGDGKITITADYDGPTYEEVMRDIQNEYNIISDNMNKIQNLVTKDDINTVEEMTDHYAEVLADDTATKNVEGMIDSVTSGYDAIKELMGQAGDEIENLSDNIEDTAGLLMNPDKIEDISSVDYDGDMTGVIISCINKGRVEGDINTGGIAGTMNIEFKADPEYDVDFTKETDVVLRTKVNCIISSSINYGVISSKKDYAGGITGHQEFGIIYNCEGYGRMSSESGSYLGGIAGYSAGSIKQSSALCNITGTDFAGGICGYGYSISNCYSMSYIEAGGECVGAIAGNVDSEGERVDNFFVSEELEGIDYITYVGIAEKVTLDELLAMDNVPKGFNTVTVRFYADDTEIVNISVPFGGYISEEDFPEAPGKEGYYTKWDMSDVDKPVVDNRVYDVEYIKWVDSVSGMEYTETGKSKFLVEGKFYKETGVVLSDPEQIISLEKGDELLYSYSWNLKNVAGTQLEYTVRVYGGYDLKNAALYVLNGNEWTQVETVIDGSYLVGSLRPGDTFAVVKKAPDYTSLYIKWGAVEAVLIIALIAVMIKRGRKKNKKK